jgi:hypothetical protein
MGRVLSESVLPALRKLVFDRTPAIRRELSVVVASWLTGDKHVARYFKVRRTTVSSVCRAGNMGNCDCCEGEVPRQESFI